MGGKCRRDTRGQGLENCGEEGLSIYRPVFQFAWRNSLCPELRLLRPGWNLGGIGSIEKFRPPFFLLWTPAVYIYIYVLLRTHFRTIESAQGFELPLCSRGSPIRFDSRLQVLRFKVLRLFTIISGWMFLHSYLYSTKFGPKRRVTLENKLQYTSRNINIEINVIVKVDVNDKFLFFSQ